MLALCDELGRRAREAASGGRATFAIPEAAAVAALIAARVPDGQVRGEAQRWLAAGAGYHELARLCSRAMPALDAGHRPFEASYGPKVSEELEPMLALWPQVLVVPTVADLSRRQLIELRAYPVHPLGMVIERAWADGRPGPPSEYFFHDLDHARFKVREDLLALGVEIPDAYRDGTTIDPATGRSRTIIPFAVSRLGDQLWTRAPRRLNLARCLLRTVDALPDPVVAKAAELLLFEILHEKSFPLEPSVLERELGAPAHLDKLRRKQETAFFGAADPGPAVVAALPQAQAVLRRLRLT